MKKRQHKGDDDSTYIFYVNEQGRKHGLASHYDIEGNLTSCFSYCNGLFYGVGKSIYVQIKNIPLSCSITTYKNNSPHGIYLRKK